jgi:large conductance mechanosensitive channel
MWEEFKKFISAGNVIDLAVGVLIGGMFGKIVTAFVEDLINPIIGLVGKVDFTNMFIPLSGEVTAKALEEAKKQGPVLAYGSFLSTAINTLILAFVIFMVVTAVNRLRLASPPVTAEAPPPPEDIILLREIRDSLKKA